MRFYGTMDAGPASRRLSQPVFPIKPLRFTFLAIAGTVAVITLTAVLRNPMNYESLIETDLTIQPPPSKLYAKGARRVDTSTQKVTTTLAPEESSDEITVFAPSEADAETYKGAALDALAKISITNVSTTDLGDACGISLFPCAEKIVSCAESKLVKTSDHVITPLSTACNCFVRGYTEPIQIPGKSDIQFTCTIDCVSSILKHTVDYVSNTNGPTGSSLTCDAELNKIAAGDYGDKNGYIAAQTESDSMDIRPVDDAKIVRAADALRISINSLRKKNCPALHTYDEAGRIVYAEEGIVADGKGQYRMEVVFGNDVVHARIAHLPKRKQVIDPSAQASLDDPENLDGRFEIMSIVPEPCQDGIPEQLAISVTGSEAINKQKLPWVSLLKAEHEGKKVKDFGLGEVPLSSEERKALYVELDVTDFTPPAAYDARDTYAGEFPCKAFKPLNQGGCGSCYAFAAATAFSARMCRFNRNTGGNVVVSPQNLMDCTNGCDGGNSMACFGAMQNSPTVELWCDPYTQVKGQCGSDCGTGPRFASLAGSIRTVGGAGTNGVLQMQLELLRGGPGVVSFIVKNDFFGYSGGIYTPSATAQDVGGHAVTLVGWGVENSIPYWIVQNSWGSGFGEGGFFRIVRGSDTCTIESRSGLGVVKPATPSVCPNVECANGAVQLKDCSCRCDGSGMTGPTCSTCSLSCLNGGVRDDLCTKCSCPMGYFGAACEGGFQLSSTASCVGDTTSVKITYSFVTGQPTQTSLVGFYVLSEKGPLKSLASTAVCSATSSKYDKTLNGGLCPTSGSFSLSPPSTPGQYKVVLAPWSPVNEFGVQGYYPLKDTNIIGLYTVLPAGCSSLDKAVANAVNDPTAQFNAAQSAATTAKAAQQAAMNSRLDSVQQLLTTLNVELPASITITGTDPANPVIWQGVPGQICFRVPPSANTPTKMFQLMVGDGSSGSFYPKAMGTADVGNLPTDYQGCVGMRLSTGIPVGLFTISLYDSANGQVYTKIQIKAAKAGIAWAGFSPLPARVTLTLSWSINAANADVRDTIKVFNSAGSVVYWFYTSCKCQTAPGAVPVLTGTNKFVLLKANSVKGGYKAKLLPAGADVVGAVAADWIPFVKYGW